jgi:hypothetical protein
VRDQQQSAGRSRHTLPVTRLPWAGEPHLSTYAGKEQPLEEAGKELRELRAEKAAWARKQKQLEAQVGGEVREGDCRVRGCSWLDRGDPPLPRCWPSRAGWPLLQLRSRPLNLADTARGPPPAGPALILLPLLPAAS